MGTVVNQRKQNDEQHRSLLFLGGTVSVKPDRFMSENLWDINRVGKTLVALLLQKLENQLQVHRRYLAGLDTLLLPKNCQKISGA
ncbi:MAG: hypothetical protein O4804_11790 [Trichodesmium sp. St11_bin5]|nr:hypothetical protein [Trichodesmium sp. St11_bin5]